MEEAAQDHRPGVQHVQLDSPVLAPPGTTVSVVDQVAPAAPREVPRTNPAVRLPLH